MCTYVHKSHNISVLLYHAVCPAKCRRAVFNPQVDAVLQEVCLEISACYEVAFLEIGTNKYQDWYKQGSCAFPDAVGSGSQSDADRTDGQEHYGEGNLSPRSVGQGATLGRCVLVEWFLH